MLLLSLAGSTLTFGNGIGSQVSGAPAAPDPTASVTH
jgi:hypothetical protein